VQWRRIAGASLVVAGVGASIVGLIGLLGGGEGADPATAASTPEPSASPAASGTASPTPSAEPTHASPTAEPEPPETPEVFFAALGRAFRSGDTRFLLSRLHPFVIDRYGEASCRAYLAGLDVPEYEVEVLDVEGDERFLYETDGLRRRVPSATAVRIRFTEDGDTFIETTGHIVGSGDGFLWFTDCGAPTGGAV
jgi:hypothetical protein